MTANLGIVNGVTRPDRPTATFTPPEFVEVGRYVTAVINDWPTFTAVPYAERYRLRWMTGDRVAPTGGLTRNLLITIDDDTTSGNYVNAVTSATNISIAALGQGSAGWGQVEFRRVRPQRDIVGFADGVSMRGDAVNARITSSHRYGTSTTPVPCAKWALSASNNDSWLPGVTFIMEIGRSPL